MLPAQPQEEGTMTLASVNAFFQPKPINVVLEHVAIARGKLKLYEARIAKTQHCNP